VSGEASIGKNCALFQQVTVGGNALPDSKTVGAPVIGDNCYIGAGAKIIGNVTVGNNVRIGANCVVYRDVPDNSVVVSNVQRVIHREDLSNRMYSYRGRWMYYDGEGWVPETDPEILETLSAAFPKAALKNE
jgi:serine O-acetyltransferase